MKTNSPQELYAPEKQYYPVSLQQEGVWLQAALDTDRSIWNTSHSWRFTGPLDINALKRAVQRLIDRHEVLRTNFCLSDEKIYQFIHPEIIFTDFFGYYDLSAYPDNIKERTAAVLEKEIAQKNYDLEKDSLIRFTLIRLAQDDHVFAVAKHHIISDVSSRQLMWQELSSLYKTYLTGGKEELEPIAFQYRDYSAWQQQFIKSTLYQDQKKYWLNELPEKNRLPRLNLVTDHLRPGTPVKVSNYSVELGPALVERMRTFSLRKRISFSSLFLAAYYVLLSRYSGQDDILIGMLFRGRNHDKKNLGKLIGLFVNHVAVRLNFAEQLTNSELLENIHHKTTAAYDNQDFLFEDLLRTIHPERTDRYAPVFQAVFNMIKISLPGLTLEGLKFKEWHGFEVDTNIASHYELSLFIRDDFKKLSVDILYARELFEQQTIERITAQYINLLTIIMNGHGKTLIELDIITDAEKQQIINQFNNTAAVYPDKTIHELFEDQVEQIPDRIALVGAGAGEGEEKKRRREEEKESCVETLRAAPLQYQSQITYHELNEQSNQLAAVLIEKGIMADSIVGIMLERSVEMIIGIYGILKAGGAYLPIDPAYPQERIDYMLKDSGSKLLADANGLEGEKVRRWEGEKGRPRRGLHHSKLAYLIYTSGSTGRPKGVSVEHASVVNLLIDLHKMYPFNYNDCYLLKTAYVFDVSVTELFGWFLGRGNLAILEPGGEKDPQKISEAVAKLSVTHINFVPSMFNAFLDLISIQGTVNLKSLRYIFLAGEALLAEPVRKFKALNTGISLENLYGPTESTVYASRYSLSNWNDGGTVPIGKPTANTQLIILNKGNCRQPIGVAGELCIGGDGLARGYLNRPELTYEKFKNEKVKSKNEKEKSKNDALRAENLHHSSFIIHHSKLYCTGDLARWLNDGNIEFLGRLDHQVKIRGFRIELGEIEAALNEHPAINESIAAAFSHEGVQNLCAYVTMSGRVELDAAVLKEYLAKKLPAYMVPAYFIKMEKFPLTHNGKIDRQALPDPLAQLNTGQIQNNYLAPQNEIQRALASVWQEVLGLPKIGISDNFFTMGGESIKAIQVSSRLAARGYRLEIALLFKYPTIQRLWEHIKKKETSDISESVEKTVSGEIKPIPIQQWFLKQNFSQPHHWNLAMMLYRVHGFNEEILKKVFVRIAAHHDALRIVLDPAGQTLLNKKVGDIVPTLEIHDLTAVAPAELAEHIENETNRVQAGIDLYRGPLLKTTLFKTVSGDHLLIVIHHLAIDGISWRILLEDISTGYEQAEKGNEIIFPDKTHAFKHWSEALAAYSRSGKLRQEYNYWRDVCAAAGTGNQEIERERGKLKDYYRCKIELPEEESRLFLNEAHRAYNTEINELLLAALALALKESSGRQQTVIHLEGHGREPITKTIDISRTVGWFTSLFPVLLEMRESDDLSMHIRRIKENLRKIPHHGIGYGVLRYLADLSEAERRSLAIPYMVGFNYLGQFDADLQRTGFKRSAFGVGHAKSPECEQVYKININGLTENSRLTFMINGDTRTFSEEEINSFARSFKNALQRIAGHCAAIKETVLTPTDFGVPDLTLEELETIHTYFGAHNIDKIYNLSPMQEGMLFHYLYDPQSRAYTVQVVYSLAGNVDTVLLKKSFETLIESREIFRTAFIYKEIKRPRQVVLKTRESEFTYYDISNAGPGDKDKRFQEISGQERERGFDLLKDILIRFTIIKMTADNYLLLVTNHHIIMDGWSMNLWLKDFLSIYSQIKNHTGSTLEITPPYENYLKWLAEQDAAVACNFWRNYLAGFEQVTQIPVHDPSAAANDTKTVAYNRDEYAGKIAKETAVGLIELANRLGVTLNTVLQVVWGIVLGRHTAEEDIVFGNVISGRSIPLEGVEHITGLFINTIPLRITINHDREFAGLVQETGKSFVECQSYGYLSVAEVQAQAPQAMQAQAANGGRLFAHLYIFENYPINKELTGRGQIEKTGFAINRKFSIEQTNYDLNIVIIPRDDLFIHFQYNENIYTKAFVSSLAGHLEHVIKQVIGKPNRFLADIEIITPEEKQLILYEFNNTSCPYPQEKTIHGLFAEQVGKSPDRIALVGAVEGEDNKEEEKKRRREEEKNQITYRQLNEQSNQLAAVLIEKGVVADSIVGIMVERSLEMIIGIYGILKAGGAYLPIDPAYPQERIEYMLKDSGTKLLAVANGLEGEKVRKWEGEKVLLAEISKSSVSSSYPLTFLPSYLQSSLRVAYLIYTSGSTGKPKGVLIEHGSLVNRLHWMQKTYTLGQRDTILHKTPFTFDVSVWEIFWWSIVGARVCLLAPGGEKDPKQITAAIYREHITVMHFVPSMLRAFLEYTAGTNTTNTTGYLYSLEQVIASGEALTAALVIRFNKILKNARLANLYGPTEATIDVSYFDCPREENIERIPIGRPIDNTHLIILNKGGQLQPIGAAGELFIGGVGLARGYLNRPELTAEKFDQDLWDKKDDQDKCNALRAENLHHSSFDLPRIHHSKLYCTGDLARRLSNGNIEFLGRIDQQVKIRGFRIELGEIEALLNRYTAIKESVVIAAVDPTGENSLCAYIVTGKEIQAELSVEHLRAYLGKTLPEYMIPSYFIPLGKIPLTASGKVDRKLLPPIEMQKTLRAHTVYEKPGSETEEKLVDLWQEILKVAKIGIHDNFFSLGGHSLKAMNFVNQVYKIFNLEIPLKIIFAKPTIASIAQWIQVTLEKRQKLTQLLLEIEALSDEEVKDLISREDML